MSPEASKPEGSQDIKNLINTNVHPEGVRPFNEEKGSLARVAPYLETPDNPSAIDPVTGNVEFTKIEIPAETDEATAVDAVAVEAIVTNPAQTQEVLTESSPLTTEKKSGWKKWVAGVVGGAVLASGSYGTYRAMNGNEPEQTTTSISPENSKPSLDITTATPDQLIGTIVDNDLSKLNARPTQELLDSLHAPISTTEFSLDQAAVEAGKKISAYYLSGDTDVDTSTGEKHVVLTPESIQEGNVLLSEIFSSDVDVTSESLDWMRGVRANTSFRLDYYGTDEQYNIEIGEPQYATSSLTWVPVGSTSSSPDSGVVSMELQLRTNFEALDRSDLFDHAEIDTNQTFMMDVAMVAENGEWRVQSLTSTS